MTTFVFWQNIISPHQFPYIKEISKIDSSIKVILVVQEDISVERKMMGWEVDTSNLDMLEIIINPSDRVIKLLVDQNKEEHHFFSGIRSYAMIYNAFKKSLEYSTIKRYLIVEGPSFYKGPLFLHYLKTLFFERKYFKYINKIFAIGHHALDWYSKFGFTPNQIVPFSYCVESISTKITSKSVDYNANFVFVGSMRKLKNVTSIITSLKKLEEESYVLTLIGDGPEKEKYRNLVKEVGLNNNIKFLGNKNNKEIRDSLHKYDVLILPSKYDGWGAVINEGLMAGLFVICSDQCGGKELIINNFNGRVFEINESRSLEETLLYCILNTDDIRNKKHEIMEWSKCIQPISIAKYFVNSIRNDKPSVPPWKISIQTYSK